MNMVLGSSIQIISVAVFVITVHAAPGDCSLFIDLRDYNSMGAINGVYCVVVFFGTAF